MDDEPLALKSLETLVANVLPNAQTHSFSRAKTAMEFAKLQIIDIAFLDIEMRSIDGLTMAKRLIKLYPKINIIFCTGYARYALDAHDLYCSAYLLKPISEADLVNALKHLRFPIEDNASPITIQCFGQFEVFYDNIPIRFKYTRTKELLAYLVDRNGSECTTAMIYTMLFGDEQHASYFRQLRKDLLDTFEELGQPHVICSNRGSLNIDRNAVKCDYFDYLDGKIAVMPKEYMPQYDFSK